MRLGFTGTREGLTKPQRARLKEILKHATEAHHGDCVGGDEEFHELAKEIGVPIIIHPPLDQKLRAFCEGAVEVRKEKPYIARNHDIVDETQRTVGCPKELDEPRPAPGQGTWSTIRYARKRSKLLEVIWPDDTRR